ncbi:MAG: hypothetical protein R3C56_32950 [Pirellulaceae bacterium]
MIARIASTIAILTFLQQPPSACWGQDLSPQQVEQGIVQATCFLISNQLADGGWSRNSTPFIPDGVKGFGDFGTTQ